MNTLKIFRWVSILEGISLLVLFGIAMPLKYMYDLPQMVEVVGMLHGLLFIAYVLFALAFKKRAQWELDILALVVMASIVPFGTFYVDKKYLSKI